MLGIPEKLYEQASSLGFICQTESDQHFIRPAKGRGSWYLTYQHRYWVLIVNNVPQMNLRYEEVLKFLEHFAMGRSFSSRPQSSAKTIA
ncbi:MAG TPA: hypothetical protein V6D06_20080 [Trichocoleus sp.]